MTNHPLWLYPHSCYGRKRREARRAGERSAVGGKCRDTGSTPASVAQDGVSAIVCSITSALIRDAILGENFEAVSSGARVWEMARRRRSVADAAYSY